VIKQEVDMMEVKKVPKDVIDHVMDYFETELRNYEVVKVLNASEHPDDDYLYMVIAKKKQNTYDGEYACWTCWNDQIKTLNFGHYNIDYETALNICNEFYRKF
jgi:hypothetical protein